MSRSKKKEAVVSDYGRNYTKYAKRWAAKAVRKFKGNITDGSYFKKIFPTWNIFDYKFHAFKDDVWYEKFKRK